MAEKEESENPTKGGAYDPDSDTSWEWQEELRRLAREEDERHEEWAREHG